MSRNYYNGGGKCAVSNKFASLHVNYLVLNIGTGIISVYFLIFFNFKENTKNLNSNRNPQGIKKVFFHPFGVDLKRAL